MSAILKIQNEIIEEFAVFDNWIQKYEYLIDLGKDLSQIDEHHKIDQNIIKGCQSRVWLHVEKKNNKIIYTADSDAIMTKGIIALLIRVFSNQKPEEIAMSIVELEMPMELENGMLLMMKKIMVKIPSIYH